MSETFHNFTGAYPTARVTSEMSRLSVSDHRSSTHKSRARSRREDLVCKVSVADSIYGPIGTPISAKNTTSRDVARIGEVDFTWGISHVVKLLALYAQILPASIYSRGGRARFRALPAADDVAPVSGPSHPQTTGFRLAEVGSCEDYDKGRLLL